MQVLHFRYTVIGIVSYGGPDKPERCFTYSQNKTYPSEPGQWILKNIFQDTAMIVLQSMF